MGEYYKFHENPDSAENPHYFLCEELLIPHTNNADTQRLNMFSNHISQFVHLKTPELPREFTGFENQIGEYSTAYKRADDDFTIIARIDKNVYNYVLLIQYNKSKVYDVIEYHYGRNITEDYGLRLNDCIPEKQPGDIVKKNEFVYKSDNYDNYGNFAYGVNLKAVYIPWKNLTYEDGVVISESAAKKLTSFKVEETMFSINGNDVLLNLYGNDDYYKSFPKIGDHIDSNTRILAAIRRKNSKNLLYNFQNSKMKTVNFENDTIIYTGGGSVVDIDIYSNTPSWKLKGWEKDEKTGDYKLDKNTGLPYVNPAKKPSDFTQEIIDVLEAQENYYLTLATTLELVIPVKTMTTSELEKEKNEFGYNISHAIPKEENPNKYTDELGFLWKKSHEIIDEKIQWRDDGKAFDNFKIKFLILKENPLTEGCKLTGRYGNKGVVTLIEKDEKMPITEDGVRADICLNPLGIINRLNPAQIIEQYINFMSDHVVKLLQKYRDARELGKMEDEFFDYMKVMNPTEYDFLDEHYIMMNRSEKEEFFDDLITNGIYMHQQPFFGNTSFETFQQLFKDKPYLSEKYKFMGIEKPMVMGDIYFIRLKHESNNKMSVRSTGLTNMKNIPSKSTLKKEKRLQISNTPIRLGEMETTNLLISKRGDIVEKLLKSYSTSEEGRSNLVADLETSQDPLNLKVINDDTYSINRKILEKYLGVLELSIEDSPDIKKK